MGSEKSRVEFNVHDDLIEIRYFDTPKDERYRSWKLPVSIADSVIAWRQKINKQKSTFPLKERTKVCEITMNSDKSVEIKSLDSMGRTNMTGWSLPILAVDNLGEWRANTRTKGKE